MSSDLWSFSLKTYALPGVQQACLRLQDDGADVCLMLCGAWLGWRGVECNGQRLAQLKALAAPWQRDVVQPLRELRIGWRVAASADADLGALREQLKTLELEAERQLLWRLQEQVRSWPETQERSLDHWLQGLATEAADRDALQVLRAAVANA